MPLNKVNLLSPLVTNSSSVTPENLQRWAYNGSDVAAITATGILDLRSATTGSLVSSSVNGNLGIKIAFYSPDLVNTSYGFGLQSGRLVSLVDATGAFSLRTSIGGSDIVRLNNDGNISGRYIDSIANSGTYLDLGTGSSGIIAVNRTASHIPFTVKGAASQTANLQEWQESGGQIRAYIMSGGYLRVRTSDTSSASIVAGPASTTQTPLIIEGLASQTGDLQIWRDSSSSTIARVTAAGDLVVGYASLNPIGNLNAFSRTGTSIALAVQESPFGGQTADLTQWLDVNSNVLAKVDIAGKVTAQSFIPLSSTIPTNGIYLPATNTIGISSNSTQRMTLDSNGSINFVGQATESVTVSATAAATTVTYDVITNKNVLYYTSNATANWTFNVRGNASVTLNSLMSTGQSLTVVFMNTNGTTAYYPTAFQIDGTAVTPKWASGTAPSAGNASSIDVYTYNIIKTASATYTVLASQSKFA